ncbi:uncharacterized protein LOC126469053 [Schistocerca serialis cubense]|uniref:uncharacterized protein LOC126469053 n=1 Tax=Schistocerca serialis cubense TaxID=2023355 RepID=UPI00214E9B45|nr:uncharacterized protein LOC126469053 [Schistocerca serialis cubense]
MTCGFDSIPDKIVKYSTENVASQIVDIINDSSETGVFPRKLKQSTVTPVYKLLDFLNQNKILVNPQNGFRKGKSTQTALFSFLKLVYKAIEDKELICGLFLDLSKVFDLISHNLLLLKLYRPNYGVRGIS